MNPFGYSSGAGQTKQPYDGIQKYGEEYKNYRVKSWYVKMYFTNPSISQTITIYYMTTLDKNILISIANVDELLKSGRVKVRHIPPQHSAWIKVKVSPPYWRRKSRVDYEEGQGLTAQSMVYNSSSGWYPPQTEVVLQMWMTGDFATEVIVPWELTMWAKVQFLNKRTPWTIDYPIGTNPDETHALTDPMLSNEANVYTRMFENVKATQYEV